MPLLKVCGLTRYEDVELVDKLADYAGFVTGAQAGPRSLSPGEARDLASTLSRAAPVLVAVGYSPAELPVLASRLEVFKVLQYHSTLSPHIADELSRSLHEVGARLSIVVEALGGWFRAYRPLDYAGVDYEYMLVDSPKSLRIGYDSGLKVPLSLLARTLGEARRVGVAGGITPGNARLVASLRPYLVDVSSGVESRPGEKDPELVKLVSEAVRVV